MSSTLEQRAYCQVIVHRIAGIPLRYAGFRGYVEILHSLPHIFGQRVVRRRHITRGVNDLTDLVPKKHLPVVVPLTDKSAFVNQAVMISTELHEIVQARLSPVRPNPPAVMIIGSMIGED